MRKQAIAGKFLTNCRANQAIQITPLLVKHQGHLQREEGFENFVQLLVGKNANKPSIG
jgi:hypothetical protein